MENNSKETVGVDAAKAVAAVKFDKIEITSDGSSKGTTILVNGKPIKDLHELSLNVYDYGNGPRLSLSYATREKTSTPGTLAETHRFTLNRPDESIPCCASAEASITETKVTDLNAGDMTFPNIARSKFNAF